MIDLKELGITPDEIKERVVAQICNQLLTSVSTDDEDNEYQRPSQIHTTLVELVKTKINEKVAEQAEKHVLPKVSDYIENLVLEKTNQWGEEVGEKQTFIEYLVKRAEFYMNEEVNYEGKSKADMRNSCSWNKAQTRIAYLIDQHLHYSIERAMKEALENANSQIVKGLEETVKIKLKEVSESLKVAVKLK